VCVCVLTRVNDDATKRMRILKSMYGNCSVIAHWLPVIQVFQPLMNVGINVKNL